MKYKCERVATITHKIQNHNFTVSLLLLFCELEQTWCYATFYCFFHPVSWRVATQYVNRFDFRFTPNCSWTAGTDKTFLATYSYGISDLF